MSRAATYVGDARIEVGPGSESAPGPGEVQLDVSFVGICGTDLHVLHGAMDARVTMPAVIGHEMSGTVSALGVGVNDWAVGDPVTVMPLVWDGTCPACLAGHHHICQNLVFVGIDSPGALQQRWTVPAHLLVALPPGLPLDHAALVEPVAVAVHDVRRSGLASGDRAVVLGGGPIGLLIAIVATEAGADVVLSEPDPGRRQLIEELGVRALDPGKRPLGEVVEEWTAGAGADVVFEVSGAPAAVLAATGLVKVRGTVVVVAIHPTPRPLDLQRVFWRELTLLGARVYERIDFERAVTLLEEGVVPAERLISAVAPLSRAAEAFATLESGGVMKVLVDCTDRSDGDAGQEA